MKLSDYFVDVNAREALARDLGASPDYLYQIATNRRQASPALAIKIETATNGAVTRADLRPDLWGDTPKPAKRAA
jgi:DNA-binding transcriptional regulator YdaS (Cro superfamily)